LRDKKLEASLKEIARLNKAGVNFKVALEQVLEQLRMTLLKLVGLDVDGGVKGMGRDEAMVLIEMFIRVGGQMKQTEMVYLPWEIAVIEWCGGDNPTQVVGVKTPPKRTVLVDPVKPPVGGHGAGKQQGQSLKKQQQGPALKKRPMVNKGTVDLKQIQDQWEEVLKAVRPHNHSLEGLLRSTRPVGISGSRVSVEVFYQFHLDQLSQGKFLQVVEDEMAKVFSSPLKLEYHLGKRPEKKQVQKIENIAATDDEDIISVAEEIFGN